jgi:hypothetical protein
VVGSEDFGVLLFLLAVGAVLAACPYGMAEGVEEGVEEGMDPPGEGEMRGGAVGVVSMYIILLPRGEPAPARKTTRITRSLPSLPKELTPEKRKKRVFVELTFPAHPAAEPPKRQH